MLEPRDILTNSTLLWVLASALLSGCIEEAPSWDSFVDGGEETPTDMPTAQDTEGDSETAPIMDTDVDTEPEAYPPGVVGADQGTISSIDGLLTETAWDISTPVNHTIEGSGNNKTTFGVVWDEFYLYIGINVVDANLHDDSYMTWQDDSVEVFIDGDYNRGTSYDEHDIQYWIEYGSNTLTVTYGMPLHAKHGLSTVDGGYTVELAVPWDDISVTPETGMKVGLDIGVNDDDNGDDRDAHHMWNGTDKNWTNTSAFGTIILQ